NRDNVKTEVLRMLISSINNYKIDKRSKKQDDSLTTTEIIGIINREYNKRIEAFNSFSEIGNNNRAQEELRESEILKKYLPEKITGSELEKLITDFIKELNSNDRQFGVVMKGLSEKLKNQADLKEVAEIVKKLLS
ncbi:MAG TPA: GatB/YqeY domain-containing protein, partial [Candidatus Paceibacterota bacterium]|nr:GatB/YqeY domain-containing protein [Candidatus Paceibacterota bacterium]